MNLNSTPALVGRVLVFFAAIVAAIIGLSTGSAEVGLVAFALACMGAMWRQLAGLLPTDEGDSDANA